MALNCAGSIREHACSRPSTIPRARCPSRRQFRPPLQLVDAAQAQRASDRASRRTVFHHGRSEDFAGSGGDDDVLGFRAGERADGFHECVGVGRRIAESQFLRGCCFKASMTLGLGPRMFSSLLRRMATGPVGAATGPRRRSQQFFAAVADDMRRRSDHYPPAPNLRTNSRRESAVSVPPRGAW